MRFDWAEGLATERIGDRGRMRQILTNLIGNAVKFTATGQVELKVTGDESGSLRLSVSDTGVGIEPSQQDRIFGEFNQIEAAQNRRFEGTGLGLSITARMVSLMEGRIWVESELGEGSTFHVALSLPLVAAERPLRVLVAEDNKTNQLVFSKTMQSEELELVFADNGQEAVTLYQQIDPDIVFMDISMPVMDGIQATKGIRRIERDTGAHVPICAVTAHTLKDEEIDPIEAGMDVVLQKPLRKPQVLEQIDRVRDRLAWAS